MNPKMKLKPFLIGLIAGVTATATFFSFANLAAQAKSRKDSNGILYTITSQNFYLNQKVLAYVKFSAELTKLLVDKSKVKPEEVTPLTNELQQELFSLDLKIKELNQ